MINWIKNNKWTSIIIAIFLVTMLIGSQFFKMLIVNSGKPVYGDRLDRIETIEITKTNINNLKSGLKESDKVTDVIYSLAGKVITVKITVTEATTVAEAKAIGQNVLKYFDKEQQSNYGIQIFLVKDKKVESFPIAGYKHYTNETISWTKDR